MITREDFEVSFPRSYEELRSLEDKIEQLLKERDAYREVAINLGGHESTIDAEAARIMEEKGSWVGWRNK